MQAIGQLAGGVAHDFNNVLTAIIGYSDLLLANHRPTDPSFQDIMQIKQNANRAAGLVRQLLAFSRRQTLRPQTLQLNDVLSELQMLLRRLVGETIELDVVHGRDLWLVKADLNQFEQVIVNLVVNARDAMRGRRPHHAAHPQRPGRRMRRPQETWRSSPADYVLVEVAGHRPRHSAGRARQDLRAVLHHQGGRQGHRPRPVDGLRHRQADRRLRVLRQRAGRRARPSASSCRATSPAKRPTSRSRRRPRSRPPISPAAARSCWSRTRRRCAPSPRARSPRAATRCSRPSPASTRCAWSKRPSGEIDLIVSDVIMPEMDGPTMLTELRRRGLDGQDRLRLRLRRRRLRPQPAGGAGIPLPAEALHAQAADRDGEGSDELSAVPESPFKYRPISCVLRGREPISPATNSRSRSTRRSRWSARCSIKGEPGTGKTLLAHEIAASLGAPLIAWHIKSTTRAQQGLYEYDAVSRLRDSQLGDARVSDIRNYIKRGKLWEAFASTARPVLLIDEIDKADIEFPNDLLLELDRMEFHVYETGETVQAKRRPIVVITSNNEKELPDAFLRRCFFHYIRFPDTETMRADRRRAFPGAQAAAGRRGLAPVLRRARDAGTEEEADDVGAARLAEAAGERGHRPRRCASATHEADPAAARRAIEERAGRASVRAARVPEPARALGRPRP